MVDSHTFEVTLDKFHYPALQEFTFIRPARFLSPKDLPQLASQRSCPTTAQRFWPTNVTQYRCVRTCAKYE